MLRVPHCLDRIFLQLKVEIKRQLMGAGEAPNKFAATSRFTKLPRRPWVSCPCFAPSRSWAAFFGKVWWTQRGPEKAITSRAAATFSWLPQEMS
jgi:hypothetical protein